MKTLFCFLFSLIFILEISSQSITPAGPINLCQGSSQVLTVTGTSGSPTYQWQKDGVDIAGATLNTYTVTLAGSYTVILNGSGPALGPVVVSIISKPVASFTFTPNNTCAKTPVTFTNTSTGTGLTYVWDFGDPNSGAANNTSTTTNPVHKFVGNPGPGSELIPVKLVVTGSNGCKDSITIDITNLQRPGTQLNGTGATIYNGLPYFRVCTSNPNATLTFTNNSSTKPTNVYYKIFWFSDASNPFNDPAFLTPIPHTFNRGIDSFLFIVSGGGPNFCIDTTKYYVFVGSNNPGVGLGNPGGTDVCMQSSLTFPISYSASNPPSTIYIFTINDGSVPDTFSHPPPSSVTHVFTRSSCGTTSSNGSNTYPNSFSAVIVASNPCATTSAAVVPIYVANKPVPSFAISPNDTACVNTTVSFTNDGVNGSPGGGDCSSGKQIWSINPATGWTIISGPLGDDNGLNDPALWSNGTNILRLNFSVPGVYAIKLKVGASAPTDTLLCGIDSITKTICVNPTPVASFIVNQNTGCAPFTVNATNTSSPTPFCGQNTYNWSVTYTPTNGCLPNTSSVVFNPSDVNPQFLFNNPGIYTIRLIAIAPAAGCSSVVATQQITVKGKPAVNLSPIVAICAGQCVTPTQTSACYIDAASIFDWSFPGGSPATSNSPNPGCITYSTSGNYTITLSVTNECGTTTVTTPLNVSIAATPVVPADTVVCAGTVVGPIALSSVPAGATITWTNSNPAIGLGAGSPPANIPSFTATNPGITPIFGIIRVQAGNGACLKSDSFKITVNPKPAIPLQTAVICSGNSFSVTPANGVPTAATVVPGGTTYTWTNPVSAPLGAITGGSAQPVGQSSISQTLINTTNASATLTYTVTPTSGAAGNCIGTAFAITVTVNPKPFVQDTTATICSGTAFSVTPSVAIPGNIIPTGTTYTWLNPVSAPVGAITGGSAQATGQSSISQVLTNTTNAPATLTYTVTPATAGSCTGTPFTITVTVNSAPTIPAQAAIICSGDIFTVTPANGVPTSTTIVPAGTTYTWINPVSAPAGVITGGSAQATGQTNISQALTNTTNTPATLTYTVTPTSGAGGNCAGATFTVTVTVNPKPTIPAQTTGICSGNTFTVTPVNGVPNAATVVPAGTTYTWINPVSAPPGAITGGSTQSVGQTSISQTLTNTLSTSATLTYTVTPTSGASGNCVGAPFTLVVTVNPKPIVQNETALICSGDVFTVTPSNATPGNAIPAGTVYTWINPVSTPPGAITGGSTQPVGQASISQALINTINVSAILTYTVTPLAGGSCAGTPFLVAVTVKAKPQLTSPLNPPAVCTNTPFIYTSVSSTANTSFDWDRPLVAGISNPPNSGGSALINETLINTTNSPVTVIYNITMVDNGCTNTQAVSLVVNPNAKSEFVTDTAIGCAPFNINQHLTVIRYQNANDEAQYIWLANGAPIGTGLAVPNFSITAPGDIVIITLIAKSKYGCKDDTSSLILRTMERPVPSFTKNVDSACGPVIVSFNNTTTPITVLNGSTYLWNFGNGSPNSTQVQPAPVTFLPSPLFRDTVYIITLRVITACDTLFKIDSVRVYANPKARFTSIPTGCSPFKDTIINNSFGQDAFTTYYWDFGDGTTDITFSTGNVFHTYNVGIVTTFTIRLIMENRCGRDTQYMNIVVSPLNIEQHITVSGTDLYGCRPHTAFFQNSSLGASLLYIDYDDGFKDTIPNSQSVFSHTFINSGVYNVRIKLKNDCTDTTVTRQITVYEKPTAAFTLQKTLLCTGESLFTNNTSINANAYEWIWGDGNTSASFNASHIYLSGGTYLVKLVAKRINTFGVVCTDTALAVTVTIVDRIPSVLVVNPTSPPCIPYTINVVASNAASALQVDWYFYDATVAPGVFHFTGPQAAYTYNTPGVYTIKLVVQNIAGCKDSSTRQITVSKKPDVVFAPFDVIICNADTTLTFSVTADAGGATPLTYEWFINNQFSGNGNPFSHHFTVPSGIPSTNIFGVKVYVRNVFGCGDTVSVGNLTIKTIAARHITVSPSLVQTQPNRTFTFSDTATALPNSIYTWITGDRNGQQLSGTPVTYEYGDTGTYKVKMIVKDYASGCVLTDSVKIYILYVPGYLWVANAFCPGCAKAELREFLPLGKGLSDYHLTIYNIWGQKVFETTSLDANGSPNKGWNGNWPGGSVNLKQGAYSWQIQAHYKNGTEWKGMPNPKTGQLQKQGFITILR